MRFSVDGAFEALARFVVRFRIAIVVFWVAVAVMTGGALPSLGSKVNNNNSAFLRSSAPSVKAANLATPARALDGHPARTPKLVALGDGPDRTSVAAEPAAC